ncbi:MAG: Crp/Fnr family transcriptional regulator [Saprospiraceae bacterium]|nr:Crp/Fnr family transcriptional regulator [Saprospiraceae bacterium]
MADQCFWFLEDVDVKSLLDPQKVEPAIDQLVHRSYKKGENIFVPKDEADKIYFVMEGRVKILTNNEEGKEVTKMIINQGEIFGELALVESSQRRDYAVAMEPTTLCIMTIEELKSVMKTHSAMGLFFMKILGQRVVDMEKRLESLVFRDSRTRIVEFLLDLAKRKGQRVGYETVVRKFMTHQDIANLTATSRQTVTTVLNDLRGRNLITFDRKRLLIRDMEKLGEEIVV